jgi:hypothetical protein
MRSLQEPATEFYPEPVESILEVFFLYLFIFCKIRGDCCLLQITGVEIGQRKGFSRGDVQKIRHMYKCSERRPGAWIQSAQCPMQQLIPTLRQQNTCSQDPRLTVYKVTGI